MEVDKKRLGVGDVAVGYIEKGAEGETANEDFVQKTDTFVFTFVKELTCTDKL